MPLFAVACGSVDLGDNISDESLTKPPGGAVGATCGTRGAAPCATGLVCIHDEAAECGATDKPGRCLDPRTVRCDLIYAPVCGCDGATYANECAAHMAGISVKSQGACVPATDGGAEGGADADDGNDSEPVEGASCGTRGTSPCPAIFTCIWSISSLCGATDLPGRCRDMREVECSTIFAPVCGCDGKIYPNECAANVAGISAKTSGACAN